MERIKVMVTIPELGRQQERALLDQMAAVSPRLHIEQRSCTTAEAVAAVLKDVEILYTWRTPAHLNEANRLRWVQTHSTGIDSRIGEPIFDPARGIVVTNAAGAHAVPIAEYCIATMSMLARGFPQLFRDQLDRTRNRHHSPPVELRGQTLGIVGYGHVGREVARLAKTYEMRILALKRNSEQRRARGYQWPGVGDPDGTLPQCLFGPGELQELLRESDFVVCCLPLTPETRNLFSEAEFAAMKPTAYFINVGRGGTVDEMALVRALREQAIAGAALDVLTTDPNPLPADHPIWDLDNVFISPHISGSRENPKYLARTNELLCENLRRYLRNDPLLNVVTREQGY